LSELAGVAQRRKRLAGEEVRRVLQSGRGIEFIVGVAEPKLLQEVAGCLIAGIVAGKEAGGFEPCERILHRGNRCFARVPMAPLRCQNVHADLVDPLGRPIWPQPAATH